MKAQRRQPPPEPVEAKRFNGLDDYLQIVEWMKASGDTFALAHEVKYASPVMMIQTPRGTQVAQPGDWIVKDSAGGFFVDGQRFTIAEVWQVFVEGCRRGRISEGPETSGDYARMAAELYPERRPR